MELRLPFVRTQTKRSALIICLLINLVSSDAQRAQDFSFRKVPISQVVNAQQTTQNSSSSLNSSNGGQSVIYAAVTTARNGGTPGTVTFNISDNNPPKVPLTNGLASCTASFPAMPPAHLRIRYQLLGSYIDV